MREKSGHGRGIQVVEAVLKRRALPKLPDLKRLMWRSAL